MTSVRAHIVAAIALVLTLFALVLPTRAYAQSEQLKGDLDNGAGVSEICSSCHGAKGMGYREGTPRLAGQSGKYLTRQLFQFRQTARTRQGLDAGFGSSQDAMTGISKLRSSARSFDGMDEAIIYLDDQDIVDVATYYASLTCTPSSKPRLKLPRTVARCKFCHGKSGNKTSATVPTLASQSAVYIRRQLKFFRSTPKLIDSLLKENIFRFSRTMHTNAKWLTADDIKDVSEYYSAEKCR